MAASAWGRPAASDRSEIGKRARPVSSVAHESTEAVPASAVRLALACLMLGGPSGAVSLSLTKTSAWAANRFWLMAHRCRERGPHDASNALTGGRSPPPSGRFPRSALECHADRALASGAAEAQAVRAASTARNFVPLRWHFSSLAPAGVALRWHGVGLRVPGSGQACRGCGPDRWSRGLWLCSGGATVA